jgi:hypothetical protein
VSGREEGEEKDVQRLLPRLMAGSHGYVLPMHFFFLDNTRSVSTPAVINVAFGRYNLLPFSGR